MKQQSSVKRNNNIQYDSLNYQESSLNYLTQYHQIKDRTAFNSQNTQLEILNKQFSKQIFQQQKISSFSRKIFYFKNILIKLILYIQLISMVEANGIYMIINSSNSFVGSLSNYTLSFNRSLNTLGQTITPSNLDFNYQISIIFDPSYNLSSFTISPSNYSVNPTSYTATINLSTSINTITINSITNPFPSQTPLKITLNFYNSSNSAVIVDTCSSTLTFKPLTFSSSSMSFQFTPGNVSSQSNVSISFIPFLWSASKMSVSLNFLTYWSRNMLNVSSNQVLGSMSYCQPVCTISNMGNFFLVQFTSLTLINNNISLNIFNILSPATLQPADTITISILETTYSSNFQTGVLTISASNPNNMQVLTPSTSSSVGNSVILNIALTTQDLFSSNDSIIIVMNTSVAMASQVTINNILVASSSYTVQQNSIITISNFILVTNIPGQFSGSITISNISIQPSVKPVGGNRISFYRNGYLYDQSFFSFNVVQANITNIQLILGSSQANANTNLTASINLSYGVISNDILYCTIDQAITVYSCTLLSCLSCTCVVIAANPSLGYFSNTIKVSNFGTTLISNMVILFSIKNPISSNYVLYFTTTDQANYTKQAGSQNYPTVTQSIISSSVFSMVSTSNTVYQPTNFTITLNFTNYTLLNGWMSIYISSMITLLDPNNKFCLVNNNNGACVITIINGTTILANISVSSQVQLYLVVINNLRNPTSTQFFSFQVNIEDMTNIIYYKLTSINYQASIPYSLTPQISSSNCTNSANNILKVNFPFLPFLPSNSIVIDDSSASTLRGQFILKQITYPINFTSNLSISIVNSHSLQPTYYQLLVVTEDKLYSIFIFNFTVTNCNPSYLPVISYTFTGLPENAATLAFEINQLQITTGSSIINAIRFITITFPTQYPNNMSISSSAQSTTQLGPRYFNLSIASIQPIIISVWGFNNVLGGFITIQTFAFSQANSYQSYLISSNTNVIQYNLSAVTNCTFPCKICSSNISVCLQCYSNSTTQFYFYDPVTQKCVVPTACSSSTFANYTVNSCIQCPIQCLTCTSLTSCLSCANNYYLLNNTCLTTCPSGYYPINPQQICAPCDSVNNSAHCLTCISINICSSCLYPYYFDASSKTCVVSCTSSQIPINSTCFACNTYCLTCQGNVTTCTSCVTNYYLLLNMCIPSCPSPYVPSTTTNICVNCSSLCLLCTSNPTTCTSCQYPLKLFNSSCISDCPIGYYTYSAGNNTLQCLSCVSQCSACTSQTICTSCISSFYFYNNTCLYACPVSTYSQNITNNNTISLTCYPCSTSCLTCTSSSACSQCSIGFYLTSSSNQTFCTSACGSGAYLNGNTCQQCSSNCLSCLNSSICLFCATAYSLQNSVCVSNCSFGFVSLLDNVYLPNSNSSAYVCKSCSQMYQYCSNCISAGCISCVGGYIINYDKTCVVVCSNGYVNISNTCVLCSSECKACSNSQTNCTSCNPGYVYYQNTTSQINRCLINCVSGTYNLSGICTSCASPCLTCVNSSLICLSCINTYFSLITNGNLNCVSSCPSNSYVFSGKCVFCSNSCSICDGNGCISCYPQYYINSGTMIGNKTYYECYLTCPTNLPYLIDNVCSKCTLNCQVCTQTNCLQCTNGTYGYNQYCLKQCPPNMVANSGICVSTNNTISNTTPFVSPAIVVPIPFTITCLIVILIVVISRLVHPNTSISISIFSIASFLAIFCNLYYLIKQLTMDTSKVQVYSVFLIVGLIINYINNLIFLFVSKYTLLKDNEFICWKRGNVELIKEQFDMNQPSHDNLQDHLNSEANSELNDDKVPKKLYTYQCVWYFIIILGFFSSQNLYTLVFSKLFDLSIFKATVESIKSLKILNYVWVVALLAHLLCLLSGVIDAAQSSPNDSFFMSRVYESVDLIFLNSICLIFGLLLLKKKSSIWQKEKMRSMMQDNNSTKKVIFDHESHEIDMNNQIQKQSQVNGRIHNLCGTQNMGSEQQIVGASVKSSTNQLSQLYFQKQQLQDNQQDMKMENNNIFMQINPDQMVPHLIQTNSNLFQQLKSHQQLQSKPTLNPDNNLQTLDLYQIQQHCSQVDQEEDNEQSNKSASDNQNNLQAKQNDQASQQQKQKQMEDWQLDDNEGDQNQQPNNSQGNKRQIQQHDNNQSSPKQNGNRFAKPLNNHKNFIRIQYNMQDILSSAEEKNQNYSHLSPILEDKLQKEDPQQREKSQVLYKQSLRKESSNSRIINYSNLQKQSQHLLEKSLSKKSNLSNKMIDSSKKNLQKNVKLKQSLPRLSKQTVLRIDNHQEFTNEDNSLIQGKDEDNNDDQLIKIQKNVEVNPATICLLSADEAVPINKQHLMELISSGSDLIQSQRMPEENFLQKRQIKTEQGRRRRDNKVEKGIDRYLPKNKNSQEEKKQSAKISGFYQIFDQYQSQSSPRMTPREVQQKINKQSFSIHQNRMNKTQNSSNTILHNQSIKKQKSNSKQKSKQSIKYSSPNKSQEENKKIQSPSPKGKDRYTKLSKYDPIKQEINQLRMSNSAHNFATQSIKKAGNINGKQQFGQTIHQDEEIAQQIQANYRTMPQKQEDITQSEMLKKSIYKSINIAKINNRLGSIQQSKNQKKSAHFSPLVESGVDRVISLPKSRLSSVKTDKLAKDDSKSVWKSRVVTNASKEQLNGTARLIERKSKLADVKAKLESIYLPTK